MEELKFCKRPFLRTSGVDPSQFSGGTAAAVADGAVRSTTVRGLAVEVPERTCLRWLAALAMREAVPLPPTILLYAKKMKLSD
jgi:hypothetical protein